MRYSAKSVFISCRYYSVDTLLFHLFVSHLIQYYGEFGIDILSYLEFSEIILSFLNTLIIIVIGSFIYMLYFVLAVLPLTKKLDLKPIRKRAIENLLIKRPLITKKIMLYLKYYSGILYWGLGLFFVLLITKYFSPNTSWESIWVIMIILIIIMMYNIIMQEMAFEFKRNGWGEKALHLLRLSSFCFLMWASTLNYAYQKAKKVKKQKGLAETSIVFTDEKRFYSTESTYFIGKTNNYLFLFNEIKKTIEIIPMKEIKRITYKLNEKKSPWFLQDNN